MDPKFVPDESPVPAPAPTPLRSVLPPSLHQPSFLQQPSFVQQQQQLPQAQQGKEALHLKREIQKAEGEAQKERQERLKAENKCKELHERVADLEQRVHSLLKQVHGQSNEVGKKAKLEDRLRELSQTRDVLETQLAEKRQLLQTAETSNQQTVDAANKTISECQLRLGVMSTELNNRMAELAKRNAQIDALTTENSDREAEQKRLEDSLEWHKTQLDQLTALLATRTDEGFQKDESLTSIQGELECKVAEVKELHNRIISFHSEIDALNGAVSQCKVNHEATKIELGLAKASVAEKSKELATQTSALRDSQHSVSFLSQQVSTLQAVLNKSDSSTADLVSQVQKTKAQLDAAEIAHSKLHEKFLEQRRLCEDAVEARDRNLKILEGERSEAAVRQASLQQKLDEQAEICANGSHENQMLQLSVEERDRMIVQLQSELTHMKDEISRLESRASLLADDCDAKRRTMEENVSFAESNAAKARGLENTVAELRTTLSEKSSTVAALMGQLESVKGHYTALQEESASTSAKNAITISQLEAKLSAIKVDAEKVPGLQIALAESQQLAAQKAHEVEDLSAKLAAEHHTRISVEEQLQAALASSTTTESALNTNIITLRSELQAQIENCEKLAAENQQISPLESQIASQAETIRQLDNRAQEAELEVKKLTEALDAVRSDAEREIASAQRSANELRRKHEVTTSAMKSEAEAAVAALESADMALREEIIQLRAELESSSHSCNSMSAAMQQKDTEFARLLAIHEVTVEEVSSLQNELQLQQKEHDSHAEQISRETQRQLNEFKALANKSQKAERFMNAECDRLRAELADKKQELTDASADTHKAREKIRILSDKYHAVNSRCDEYKQAHEKVLSKLELCEEYRKRERMQQKCNFDTWKTRYEGIRAAHDKLFALYTDLLDVFEGRKPPSAPVTGLLRDEYDAARQVIVALPSAEQDKENMQGKSSISDDCSSQRPQKRQRSEKVVEIRDNEEVF